MAAHRSLSVTQLYAHATDEARREAANRIDIATEMPPTEQLVLKRRATSRATKPDGDKRKAAKLLVPRGGIEPPTRGFSGVTELWPSPRKDERKGRLRGVAAASVQQRGAGAPSLRAVGARTRPA